jgi:prepilin-type N-terminal cleavage/methylation domain-containing protein
MSTPSRRPQRGVTLLELIIAMAVLSFGLLAMSRLHVVGLTSNAAARRNTSGVAIAQELAAGLERLGFNDALLSDPSTPTGTPPTDFGPLVQSDGTISSGPRVHTWSDATPVPGVRSNAQLRERSEPGTNLERRWLVWTVQAVDGASGVPVSAAKLVAVSVTWNDPAFSRAREVLLYTQVANKDILREGTANKDKNDFDKASEGH